MAHNTSVTRYQQSFTGRSDKNLSRRPCEAREATRQDAQRHQIPDWYIIKHWNPDEKPIFLLGTVFDSDSLGKWIFDWTIKENGPQTPMGDIAGDLWLSLLRLYGGIKRSEEFIHWNRGTRNPKLCDDLHFLQSFIETGRSLRKQLDRLLRKCEEPMLRTDTGNRGRLGKEAGFAFVDALFGREDLLEETEKLQQRIRLWIRKWDEECAEIVNPRRKPDQ